MSEQAKFSVKGLDLYYGDFHALKDVNLDINAKEITALISRFTSFNAWKSPVVESQHF